MLPIVILHLYSDSKRINTQLHNKDGGNEDLINSPIDVNALIVSTHFWPPFKVCTQMGNVYDIGENITLKVVKKTKYFAVKYLGMQKIINVNNNLTS